MPLLTQRTRFRSSPQAPRGNLGYELSSGSGLSTVGALVEGWSSLFFILTGIYRARCVLRIPGGRSVKCSVCLFLRPYLLIIDARYGTVFNEH